MVRVCPFACSVQLSVRKSTKMSRKKTVRTLDQRLKIVEEVEKSPGETRVSISKRLGLATSTLNSIYHEREKIREEIAKCGSISNTRKTSRTTPFEEMETVLIEWFRQARANNLILNGAVIRRKAIRISERLRVRGFAASNGWIDRFRQRHDLAYRQEKAAVDRPTNLNFGPTQTPEFWKAETLPHLIRNYELRDVYTADETGLFFSLLPEKTWEFRGDTCNGGKRSKSRLTILLTCNADGSDMLTPLVIGRTKRPRGFKDIQKLPVEYKANNKAWMTGTIFVDFLKAFDAKMGVENRKVLLFIDHCPAHPPDIGLKNVTVVFFPANCTASHLQPLDMGLKRCLKSHYRRSLVRKALVHAGMGNDPAKMKMSLLHAVHYIANAWRKISPVTVTNCFRQAGFFHVKTEAAWGEPLDDLSEIDSDNADWADITGNFDLAFEDYVEVDDYVATSGTLTVDEFVDAHLADSESEEEAETTPTYNDVMRSFETLRLFLYRQDIDEGVVKTLADLERSLCRFRPQSERKLTQRDIRDFLDPLR